MRDPIDELEGFSMPSVSPLPPAEVRRRGDRIRRRNNTLAAVGGLAVVAAIVAPIAVLAGHDPASRSVPPADQPPGGWVTTVPADFDITAVPDGSQVRFSARADSVVTLTLCGAPAFSTGPAGPAGPATDMARAGYGEIDTESAGARTLAVYADDKTASAALAGLRSGVEDCPVDTGDATVRWAVVDAPAVGDESLVFSQQVQFDPDLQSDLVLAEVVRSGNALLMATTHTSAGGDQVVEETVPVLRSLTAPVVAQMCVFGNPAC